MKTAPTRCPRVLLALLAAAAAGAAAAQPVLDSACGNPFVNTYGPHDYRNATQPVRHIVEDYHFTPRVEQLISGQSASVGSDLDYTLRAFPNHHRALVSMMNLGVRTKNPRPQGAQFSVECYFQRAIAFRPDDLIVHMLYARFLDGAKRRGDALREVDYVVSQAEDNPFTHYNTGLLYMELGEPAKALAQAHKAMALGFTRTELKQQLQAAGKWVDPPAAPEAPASAASAP